MMKTGMLWFDDDPKTALIAKIERAVDYYMRKYYRVPNLVLIHPSMLPEKQEEGTKEKSPELGKIVVRPARYILPGHMLVGIEEKS